MASPNEAPARRPAARAAWWAARLLAAALTLLGAWMLILGVPPEQRLVGLAPLACGVALLLAVRARAPAGFAAGVAGGMAGALLPLTAAQVAGVAALVVAMSLAATARSLRRRAARGQLVPRLRPRAPLQAALLAVAVVTVLCWWSTQPLLHARLYAELGWHRRAHSAAERVPPDQLQALPIRQRWHLLCGPPDDLLALLEELDRWPWLVCSGQSLPAAGPGSRGPSVILISAGPYAASTPPRPWRRGHRVRWDLVLRPGQDPLQVVVTPESRAMRAGELVREALDACRSIPPSCREPVLLVGLTLAQRRELRSPTWQWLYAMRRGHLPMFTRESWTVFCATCGDVYEPAAGVRQGPLGALSWTRGDGSRVELPPPTWFPSPE